MKMGNYTEQTRFNPKHRSGFLKLAVRNDYGVHSQSVVGFSSERQTVNVNRKRADLVMVKLSPHTAPNHIRSFRSPKHWMAFCVNSE
jgi:hypothetical protein